MVAHRWGQQTEIRPTLEAPSSTNTSLEQPTVAVAWETPPLTTKNNDNVIANNDTPLPEAAAMVHDQEWFVDDPAMKLPVNGNYHSRNCAVKTVMLPVTWFDIGSRASLWSNVTTNKYIPAPSFGLTGMPRKQFDDLWMCIRFSEQPPNRPSDMTSEQYRWRLVDDFVKNFNEQSKEYFHRVTGHAGHHLVDTTAKYYKVDLTGKVNNCLSCSVEKIRQKNIPKKNEDKSKNPGERMYLDISSMRKPSMGGRQHWVMLVDEATKYKKSFFLKKKNEQVEPIIDWIKALKVRHKIQVTIIRCDNAGENKVLERESDKNELGIIFEYTAPGTPQRNGVVERAFVTVMGRARAMMNHAGFTMAKRQQLWCEAAQTATMLDNILVQESAKSPPFTQFLE